MTKVVSMVPATAPRVLAAYSPPTDQPSWRSREKRRSAAGNVAPMATVAGSSKKKGTRKATVQWRRGEGETPIKRVAKKFPGGMRNTSTTAQAPMSNSREAYQRPGTRLVLTRRSRLQAPRARPLKKAATTASTAGIS